MDDWVLDARVDQIRSFVSVLGALKLSKRQLVALMRACWQFDASERPSFSGILDEIERIAAAAEITFD